MSRIINKIFAKIFTRFPTLVSDKAVKIEDVNLGEIPFSPFTKKLKDARVSIITSAGVHLKTQEPFNMEEPNGDPTIRFIPSNVTQKDLTITHDYYDHIDADHDINVVYPIDHIDELVKDNVIGSKAQTYYGFMGHIKGPFVKELVEVEAIKVAENLKKEQVDFVILSPG